MEADVVCHKSNVKQLYQSQNSKTHALFRPYVGSKGGAVVRALASHQCGPGSNPGVRFFSGYSGFPLPLKTNTFKFQFDLERTDTFKRVHKNS